MKVMERDWDGGLMSLVSRRSDCSDARWTPRYRDSQLVTVNIKVTSCTKYMQAQPELDLVSAGLGISLVLWGLIF